MTNTRSIAVLILFSLCCIVAHAQNAFDVKNQGTLLSQEWSQVVLVKTYPDSESCSANGEILSRHPTKPAFVYTSFPKEGEQVTFNCSHPTLGTLEVTQHVSFDEAYHKKVKTGNTIGGLIGGGVGGLIGGASADIPFSYYYPGLLSFAYDQYLDENLRAVYFEVKEDWQSILVDSMNKKSCKEHKERKFLCSRNKLLNETFKAELQKLGYKEVSDDIRIPYPKISYLEEPIYWEQLSGNIRTRLRSGGKKLNAACMQIRFTINSDGEVQNAKIAKIYPVDKKLASNHLKEIRKLKFKPSEHNIIKQPVETNRVMVLWKIPKESMRKDKYLKLKELIHTSCE